MLTERHAGRGGDRRPTGLNTQPQRRRGSVQPGRLRPPVAPHMVGYERQEAIELMRIDRRIFLLALITMDGEHAAIGVTANLADRWVREQRQERARSTGEVREGLGNHATSLRSGSRM